MLNDDWNAYKQPRLDLMPEHLRAQREAKNNWIYENINNAVYRTGFASTQAVYSASNYLLLDALTVVKVSTYLIKSVILIYGYLLL